MVFCFQKNSDLLWEKIVLVIEKSFWNSRLKTENLHNFWDHHYNLFLQGKVNTIFEKWFLTWYWRFLRSDARDQLKFKLGKKMGFKNLQEKLEKVSCLKVSAIHEEVSIGFCVYFYLLSKIIIYKSSGEPFLWNIICDMGLVLGRLAVLN